MSEKLSNRPVILASGSPRRRDILTLLGITFEINPADIDEQSITDYNSPRGFAMKAAVEKACVVDDRTPHGGVTIAADTIVVFDSQIFCKPSDAADARRMLRILQGNSHKVITAVAIKEKGQAVQVDAVESSVMIRKLIAQEIDDYVATGEPLDKAGAYGVQGEGRKLIASIDGDFYNVVGLPVKRTLEMLDSLLDTSSYRRNFEQLEKQFGERVIR